MNEKLKKGLKISGIVVGALIILMIGASFFVNNLSKRDLSSSFSYGAIESAGIGASKMMDLGITMNQESDSMMAPRSGGAADTRPLAELTEKKIIKNGSLTIYVEDAEQTAQAIQNLTLSVGGFVAESNIYEARGGEKRGSITIRVPASEFEEIMGNVKGLAALVERENASSDDVTEEYVDIEAQLRNLRAEETQYLEIMQRAFSINDTLQVANRLSDVRGRIERHQGRLQFLSRQVEMSTIHITLEADADVAVFGLRWRPLIVIKQSMRDMLENLSGYVDTMIRILFQLPVVLLWLVTVVIVAVIGWRLILWIFHRFFKRKIK